MSETTQGCSPPPKTSIRNSSDSNLPKNVDLGAIVFTPSQYLWRAHVAVYAVMLISAAYALAPFLLSNIYWALMLIGFLTLLLFALYRAKKINNKPAITLEVRPDQWRLFDAGNETKVVLEGEVLLWPRLIILPLKEIPSGAKRYLVALPDSLSKNDWRRLSVWLKICLR